MFELLVVKYGKVVKICLGVDERGRLGNESELVLTMFELLVVRWARQ